METEHDPRFLLEERDILQDRLVQLHEDLKTCRKECIVKGHSLHEIDLCLRHEPRHDQLDGYWDQPTRPRSAEGPPVGPTDATDGSVYGEWSSSRDRINRWLLHCMHSDKGQRTLHESMLAEYPADSEEWEKQVLESWYLDEAAVGEDLQLSRSVDAVDGRDGPVSDGSASVDKVLSDDLEASILTYTVDINEYSTLFFEDISPLLQLDEELLPPEIIGWLQEEMRMARPFLLNPCWRLLQALLWYWEKVRFSRSYCVEQWKIYDFAEDFRKGVYYLLVSLKTPVILRSHISQD